MLFSKYLGKYLKKISNITLSANTKYQEIITQILTEISEILAKHKDKKKHQKLTQFWYFLKIYTHFIKIDYQNAK